MTEKDDPKKPAPDALEALAVEGLRRRGELVPTSESAVSAAEDEGVEFDGELPESLREYRPRGFELGAGRAADPKVVSLSEARARRSALGGWPGHLVSAAVGAAAAGFALGGVGTKTDPPVVSGAGHELRPEEKDTRQKKIRVEFGPRCASDCCGGSECARSTPDLRSCQSGRSCIRCSFDAKAPSRYRLRMGQLAFDANARKHVEGGKGPLEACTTAGSLQTECVPVSLEANDSEPWRLLSLVVSAQDLLAGLRFEVKSGGYTLASWSRPVTLGAGLLCSGLLLQPTTPKGEIVGTVSAFLEDTHYVELARAAAPPSLLESSSRFEFSGVKPDIYETKRPGVEHFALVLGPFDRETAERLRWSVLDGGGSAELGVGADFIGEPRPSR
jgi:hypothetical protein